MDKYLYEVTMTHSEESLTALAHMQYDLFCTRNYIARSLLSLAAISVGAVYFSRVWGIALLAYGAYLITSTYSSSNHTVKKIIETINSSGAGFPSSRYLFAEKQMDIIYHPGKEDEGKMDPVFYTDLVKLGEDTNFFYLFPHSRGGYCVPKDALLDHTDSFRRFIEGKTDQRFYRRRPSPLQRLREWLRKRENEPQHL